MESMRFGMLGYGGHACPSCVNPETGVGTVLKICMLPWLPPISLSAWEAETLDQSEK
jgi:hypothetical protein